VTSVVPNTGSTEGGSSVTITGTSFLEVSAVEFGSAAATSYTVESPTKIKATAPAGTGIVNIRVTTAFGQSKIVAADTFTYTTAPEFGRCLKVTAGTGGYGSSTCTTTGGTKTYEWYPAFGGSKPLVKKHFSLKSKELPEVKLAAATGEPITCKAEIGGGEINGPQSVTGVTMTFTTCHRGTLGTCTTAGALNEGEVSTVSLNGKLGVVKVSTEGPVKNKLGLDLEPASGTTVAEFSCGGITAVWTGSVIVEVKANAMFASMTETYTGSKGVQKPAKFEGGLEDQPFLSINGEAAKKAALIFTNILTPEEKIEINSVV
jgi:hypothetical protein